MPLPLPTSLSPSKVTSFKDCALAFRFSAIDRLPEPPSPHAAKGTLVHRALELLFWEEEPGRRSRAKAGEKLSRAVGEVLDGPEYAGLDLRGAARDEFVADAASLLDNYFTLEDPDSVRVIGTELRVSVRRERLVLRGIIDRLELDGDGELVVTDYKTGRAPSEGYEQGRLSGVHFYAFLCEELLGRRPARVQLLHLREPMRISTVPTAQSVRGLYMQASAVWTAVERACEREDFRPKPGPLCPSCAFQAYCPAMGGDLSLVPPPAAPPPPLLGAGGEPAPPEWPAPLLPLGPAITGGARGPAPNAVVPGGDQGGPGGDAGRTWAAAG